MGWVVLAVFALLLFVVSNFISYNTGYGECGDRWTKDHDRILKWHLDEAEKLRVGQLNDMAAECFKKTHALSQKHEDELIDLRRRCINYVVAMREADVAAGKEPFAGMAFEIALGSVPLRVGKDA